MAVLVFLVHCSFIAWRNSHVYVLACVTRGHRNYSREETCRTECNIVVLVVLYSTAVCRYSRLWHSGSPAGPDSFGPVIAHHSHWNYNYSTLSYLSASSLWYAVRYSIFFLRSFYFTFQWYCFVCYPYHGVSPPWSGLLSLHIVRMAEGLLYVSNKRIVWNIAPFLFASGNVLEATQ